MLIIAPEWPGPQYSWWTALCALCPRRRKLPQDRPLYLRAVTDLMPAPRWRTWAFLLDSREGCRRKCHSQRAEPPTAGPLLPEAPRGTDPGAELMTAQRHTDKLPARNLAREVGMQAGRAALPPHGATRGRPNHTVGRQTPPFLAGPSRIGTPGAVPTAGGGTIQFDLPSAGETPPQRVSPHGTPRMLLWQPTRNQYVQSRRVLHGTLRWTNRLHRWALTRNKQTRTCRQVHGMPRPPATGPHGHG